MRPELRTNREDVLKSLRPTLPTLSATAMLRSWYPIPTKIFMFTIDDNIAQLNSSIRVFGVEAFKNCPRHVLSTRGEIVCCMHKRKVTVSIPIENKLN
ncbi:hypothetical protein PoB_004365100 [Plakobranchus ocellatus]|uniref:Uncharacterized protein n=1 Tax=Plakobranchus ocellatus TaxID=259542 RepID=A0AAV4BEC2_9GAST|nr:hypothetical protein PoB_004365100 [Plakobranchus ocellatus]